MQVFTTTEISAALFQAAVALGLTGLFFYLYRRYAKPHFLWWAIAWGLFTLRLVAIIAFLASDRWAWLFWHQVATGWTALGLLWAALVFSRQIPLRPSYLLTLLFPVGWSFVAIFQLDTFILAAVPAVLFLSGTTGWTGWVFLQYRRRTGSSAALFLAAAFGLWAVHHLDYPFLRARGAWNPWGYYLDTLFLLLAGAGVLLLVIEELRQGLMTMSALSGELQRDRGDESHDVLLRRPLALSGVRGAAIFRPEKLTAAVAGVGACEEWTGSATVPTSISRLVGEVIQSGHPILHGQPRTPEDTPAFTAVLPLRSQDRRTGALVIIGDLAAPFAALDDRILVAMGDQIGAALENAELYQRLAARTADLERLSVRMLQQHEEQRLRTARELHDETAQVFSALKLQLGSLREAAPELAARLDTLLHLVGAGRESIRHVTEDLRPAMLDDLGLLPALRALISDFQQWSGIAIRFAPPDQLPALAPDAELALFRAVQEGLSNAARHAQAKEVVITLTCEGANTRLTIRDDGVGLASDQLDLVASGPGRSGLFGMRERIEALGGTVTATGAPGEGVTLLVVLGSTLEVAGD